MTLLLGILLTILRCQKRVICVLQFNSLLRCKSFSRHHMTYILHYTPCVTLTSADVFSDAASIVRRASEEAIRKVPQKQAVLCICK